MSGSRRIAAASMPGGTIVNIQALRALAALLVVCVHMAAFGTLIGWNARATAFGNCCVDLFFVISGFIMMHTIASRATTAPAFLLNRIVRVVPLYWLMTCAVFGIALAAPGLLGDTRANWSNLALSLAFIPFDRGGGSIEPVFFLGWTLNYEMFFYLCFALALWITRGRPGTTLVVCGVLVGACVCTGWMMRPSGVAWQFYTNDIMLEFVFGMAAARIASLRRPPHGVALLMVAAGLIVMIWGGAIIHAPRWSVAGLAAMVVLIGAVWAERDGVRASARGVQAIGAASYALYLTHPFVMQAFGKLAARTGGGAALVAPLALVAVIAAIAVAVATHRLVELPITHALRRASGQRRAVVERIDPLVTKERDKIAATQ